MDADELIREELATLSWLRAGGLTRFEAIRRLELALHVPTDPPSPRPAADRRPPAGARDGSSR